MDDIRANALRIFDERLKFTEKAQQAHILCQSGPAGQLRPSTWEPSEESELVKRAKHCVKAGESMLIRVPAITTDAYWDFQRETFMTLVDLFQLDHAVLRPISTIESAFALFPGDQTETLYIRISTSLLVWSFNMLSRTTRGLIITCGTEKYEMNETHSPSPAVLRLSHRTNLFCEPMGLLWHCFFYGLGKSKEMNDMC